jgi:chaperonin GroES
MVADESGRSRENLAFSDVASSNFLMVGPPLRDLYRQRRWCGPPLAGPRTSAETKETEMKIRPLHDHVLVKRIAEQQKTTAGLFIPDSAKEKPMEATVVAVGAGKVQEDGSVRKMSIKAGDRVLFTKYSGNEIKIDGTEHLILREDDVLALVE